MSMETKVHILSRPQCAKNKSCSWTANEWIKLDISNKSTMHFTDSAPVEIVTHIGLSDTPYTNLEIIDTNQFSNCTSVFGSNLRGTECRCNSGASGSYLYVYAACCAMDIFELQAYARQQAEMRM